MDKIKIISIGLVACLISFSVGRYFSPTKTEIKEVAKTSETKKTDTVRVVDKKETVLPNGTRIIETNSETKRITDSQSKSERSSETKIESRPNYRISSIYFPEIKNYQTQNVIFCLEKRVVSDLYLGVSISTQKQIGVSISLGL